VKPALVSGSCASKQAGQKQPAAFSGIGRNCRFAHQHSGPGRHWNSAPQPMHLALGSSGISHLRLRRRLVRPKLALRQRRRNPAAYRL